MDLERETERETERERERERDRERQTERDRQRERERQRQRERERVRDRESSFELRPLRFTSPVLPDCFVTSLWTTKMPSSGDMRGGSDDESSDGLDEFEESMDDQRKPPNRNHAVQNKHYDEEYELSQDLSVAESFDGRDKVLTL
jgi:hypothetical protein